MEILIAWACRLFHDAVSIDQLQPERFRLKQDDIKVMPNWTAYVVVIAGLASLREFEATRRWNAASGTSSSVRTTPIPAGHGHVYIQGELST